MTRRRPAEDRREFADATRQRRESREATLARCGFTPTPPEPEPEPAVPDHLQQALDQINPEAFRSLFEQTRERLDAFSTALLRGIGQMSFTFQMEQPTDEVLTAMYGSPTFVCPLGGELTHHMQVEPGPFTGTHRLSCGHVLSREALVSAMNHPAHTHPTGPPYCPRCGVRATGIEAHTPRAVGTEWTLEPCSHQVTREWAQRFADGDTGPYPGMDYENALTDELQGQVIDEPVGRFFIGPNGTHSPGSRFTELGRSRITHISLHTAAPTARVGRHGEVTPEAVSWTGPGEPYGQRLRCQRCREWTERRAQGWVHVRQGWTHDHPAVPVVSEPFVRALPQGPAPRGTVESAELLHDMVRRRYEADPYTVLSGERMPIGDLPPTGKGDPLAGVLGATQRALDDIDALLADDDLTD